MPGEINMPHWYCPNCKNAVLGQNVTFQELHETCGTKVVWSDGDCPPILTAEVARKIWDAAIEYYKWSEVPPLSAAREKPDFDTFYKQLIEIK
jgi:hypothetical protein